MSPIDIAKAIKALIVALGFDDEVEGLYAQIKPIFDKVPIIGPFIYAWLYAQWQAL